MKVEDGSSGIVQNPCAEENSGNNLEITIAVTRARKETREGTEHKEQTELRTPHRWR